MIGDIVAVFVVGGLALVPIAWREWKDRREGAALIVRADIQATANRVLGGESFLTVVVTPPWLRRPGQVRLSAPAGWECLIEAVWPRIMTRMPERYELVVESHGPAVREPECERVLRAAA